MGDHQGSLISFGADSPPVRPSNSTSTSNGNGNGNASSSDTTELLGDLGSFDPISQAAAPQPQVPVGMATQGSIVVPVRHTSSASLGPEPEILNAEDISKIHDKYRAKTQHMSESASARERERGRERERVGRRERKRASEREGGREGGRKSLANNVLLGVGLV